LEQFFVGVGGIVEQDGKILVLKRSSEKDFAPDSWEIVTGRLEVAENPSRGILREITEETTINAEVIMPINTSFFYRGGKEFPMVVIDFWCRYVDGEVKLSWEHSEHKWITFQDALRIADLKSYNTAFSRILALKTVLPKNFVFGKQFVEPNSYLK
jgi:8-oxo-dGTP diphosphatase